MNFLDLQNFTAYTLDDLNFGYFTPVQVKLWLNNGQKRVQNRLIQAGENYYVKGVQTSLVVNQRDYVLPEDFKKLNRLEVLVSGSSPTESVTPVMAITLNQQDLVGNSVGTPSVYTIKRNRLILRPAPDTALTLRMEYTYQVTDLVLDTDEPDCPESYHELIALYACEDGYIKDGRASPLLDKKIKEFEKQMDRDAIERQQDSPRMIVETGNSQSGGIYF